MKNGIKRKKFNVSCYCCEISVECYGPEWYDDVKARMLPNEQHKKDNWSWTMTEGGIAAFCGDCQDLAYKNGILKTEFRKKIKEEFLNETRD